MRFLDGSPDPFHACANVAERLRGAGFEELSEVEAWAGKLKKGGKYFFTRNRSCIVAFAVGSKYTAGQGGFKVIGAHTDSPNLKVKPRSKLKTAAGCTQIDVECYGGGLWHTWFDRDLSVSGRVVVRTETGIEQRLVKLDQPLLRVPTLCIHLQSPKEREAFAVNKEEHLQPILADAAARALTGEPLDEGGATGATAEEGVEATAEGEGGAADEGGSACEWGAAQEPMLLSVVAEALGVDVAQIADFELNLYDTQPAALCGARSEFLNSARLDNLASCFLATEALVAHATEGGGCLPGGRLSADADISLIALFDHEEVGSSSAVGAGSPIMAESVRRISASLAPTSPALAEDMTAATIGRSFVLSVDMAHAVHPNYQSKHEQVHGPKLNNGIVIKSNSNQRYASTPVTSFIVRELARRSALPPPQEFVVRNDCPCGSTIGPIISAATGIRAVDVGLPQLSMHSVREMMGVDDLGSGLAMFKTFFKDFRELDQQLK